MPNSRRRGKTFKGAWLEEGRIEQLKKICSSLGIDFTEFLRGVADGDLLLVKNSKKEEEVK